MGTAISAANARAAISTFMTRLHIWTIVVFGITAWADRPAPAGPNMPTPVLPRCDGNHNFRMIQKDSYCPGNGRNAFAGGPNEASRVRAVGPCVAGNA
jgi:hypothetical protein